MWEKIDAFVEKNQMLFPGETVVLGLSGGADSVCLLRYLLYVRKRIPISILPVHVNHGIRGEEAERDQEFCEVLCRRFDLDLTLIEADVPGLAARSGRSLEEEGRICRYQTFKTVAKEHHNARIAVAHHRDDQVETMLFRMARGTGLFGLVGMHPVNGDIIRPLLDISKDEILKILYELGQDYVTDSSNEDTVYSRNYIRHTLVPGFHRINQNASAHIASLSVSLREMLDHLEPEIENCFVQHTRQAEEGLMILGDPALDPFMQSQLFHRAAVATMGGRDLSGIHIKSLMDLSEAAAGSRIDLPGGYRGIRTDEGILITSAKPPKEKQRITDCTVVDLSKLAKNPGKECRFLWGEGYEFTLTVTRYDGSPIPKSNCIKYFDYDKITGNVFLRSSRQGDFFSLETSGKHKKLRRHYIDCRIPEKIRDALPLLADEREILWVVETGRANGRYLVEKTTKNLLVCRVTRKPSLLENEEKRDGRKNKDHDQRRRG